MTGRPDPWGQGPYALPPPPPDPPPDRSGAGEPMPGRALGDDGTRPEVAADDGATPGDRFGAVEEFVNGYLALVVCRRLGQGTALWCPEWWRHREAVVRLHAVWRAFEHLTRDPDVGMSTWWLYHADPHLRALTDPDSGPFALCDPVDGHASYPLPPLPVRAAPPRVWEDPVFRLDGDR